MADLYIGLDLGKKGGIVVMKKNGDIIDKAIMPLAGNEICVLSIARIMQGCAKKGKCHVVIEKFSGFFGYSKSAAVSLAMQSGMVRATCSLLKIPYTTVTPQTWQKEMWQGTTIQYKKSQGKKVKDTKKTSLLTAKRLFPTEEFKPTKRYTNPHDGLVDAALLAEFGRRKGF